MSHPYRYIVIAGPTASGKSSLALKLAKELDGEIVNCDSIQLYRGFNIGAAKPNVDELAAVPHHLIDVLDYTDECDARSFASMAEAAIDDILSRGKRPIVVGGTGLYLRALWQEGWHDLPKSAAVRQNLESFDNQQLHQMLMAGDPERAQKIHENDRYRLIRANELLQLTGRPLSEQQAPQSKREKAYAIYVDVERAILHRKIETRCLAMIAEGLEAEVKGLLELSGCAASKPMQSIGYKQMSSYLQGELAASALVPSMIYATRQYAKRQITWFKKVSFESRFSHETSDVDALLCNLAKLDIGGSF